MPSGRRRACGGSEQTLSERRVLGGGRRSARFFGHRLRRRHLPAQNVTFLGAEKGFIGSVLHPQTGRTLRLHRVWCTPDKALLFGIILDAVAAHGDTDLPLPAVPPFFLSSDPNASTKGLAKAGFTKI